jgi:DNA-binding NtrC family response regulator
MTRLLIIDDHSRDQERYSTFLTDYEIRFCRDGNEALALLGSEKPPAQAVLVSWELSGEISGAEFLVRSRRVNPEVPVIMVSGLLDLSRAARAKALGAFDFLLKPLDRDVLQDRLEAALRTVQEPELLPALQSRMIGKSRSFVAALESVARVIPQLHLSVLLTGESGVGKEPLAHSIHALGRHANQPWVPVNIAGIQGTLLDSTLFGHERGAFTDARERRIGAFEESADGTLFLDEIGDLDLALQSKLLRVIQERTFRRLGGSVDLKFSARLVCATNRNLSVEIRAGRFREDLYHRIAQCEIRVPPLRDRGEDLWLLTDHFLSKHGHGKSVRLARETRALLAKYTFTGNVRELENILIQGLLEGEGCEILPQNLPLAAMAERYSTSASNEEGDKLSWPQAWFDLPHKSAIAEVERAFNRDYLPRKLKEAAGVIIQAAGRADLDRKTFSRKYREAGLPDLPGGEESPGSG